MFLFTCMMSCHHSNFSKLCFDCCIKKFGVCRNCLVCLSICLSVQLCLVHICLTEEHWKFLLYTMIALDPRVSYNFDPRTFWQGQGHWKEREHNSCLVYILLRNKGSSYFHLKVAYDLRVCPKLDPSPFVPVPNNCKKKLFLSF